MNEEKGSDTKATVVAKAKLPTRFGEFQVIAFEGISDGKEHIAISYGDIEKQEQVLTRLHSECLTGDVMCSLKCDCRDQLEKAMQTIVHNGSGVILYLRQEGRGIGLTNKIRAYEIQDTRGLNTNEANEALGFPADARNYTCAGEMLQAMNISEIDILTNNPDKIQQIEMCGIKIRERVSLETKIHQQNKDYLETKKTQSGHLLNLNNS